MKHIAKLLILGWFFVFMPRNASPVVFHFLSKGECVVTRGEVLKARYWNVEKATPCLYRSILFIDEEGS